MSVPMLFSLGVIGTDIKMNKHGDVEYNLTLFDYRENGKSPTPVSKNTVSKRVKHKHFSSRGLTLITDSALRKMLFKVRIEKNCKI